MWSPGWQRVSTCWPAGWWRGRVRPADLSAGADALARGLAAMDRTGYVEPGFAMDSAWRGALPPEAGFVHLDDVPARVVLDLAQRGVALAKEHGSAHGPPASLLDQEVVAVSSGDTSVGIPMRCVFALTAMGFLPQSTLPGMSSPRNRWPPTRSCGSGCCRRGCASMPGSARCTAAAATPRSFCVRRSQAAVFGGSLPSDQRAAGQQHLARRAAASRGGPR